MKRFAALSTLIIVVAAGLTAASTAAQPILKSDNPGPELQAALLAEQAASSIVAQPLASFQAPPARIAPPVPEPGTMIALGAAAAVFFARRKKAA